MTAQLIGAFVAGFLVWCVLAGEEDFDYGNTYPHFVVGTNEWVNVGRVCIAEFIATFFLVFMVFATAVDKKNCPYPVYGFAIAGTVGMCALGGDMGGAALNPFRWLGPAITGWWAFTQP
jgi:glycerol uptake facilitator-like aquaporin